MNLRLFFLFPDREHALRVVNELAEHGFDTGQMHAVAGKGRSARGLPVSTPHQREDLADRLEFWAWRSNLAVFFSAAAILVAMIFMQAGLWILLPVAVMRSTIRSGATA